MDKGQEYKCKGLDWIRLKEIFEIYIPIYLPYFNFWTKMKYFTKILSSGTLGLENRHFIVNFWTLLSWPWKLFQLDEKLTNEWMCSSICQEQLRWNLWILIWSGDQDDCMTWTGSDLQTSWIPSRCWWIGSPWWWYGDRDYQWGMQGLWMYCVICDNRLICEIDHQIVSSACVYPSIRPEITWILQILK